MMMPSRDKFTRLVRPQLKRTKKWSGASASNQQSIRYVDLSGTLSGLTYLMDPYLKPRKSIPTLEHQSHLSNHTIIISSRLID